MYNYVYIYIYMCVCVCVCMFIFSIKCVYVCGGTPVGRRLSPLIPHGPYVKHHLLCYTAAICLAIPLLPGPPCGSGFVPFLL